MDNIPAFPDRSFSEGLFNIIVNPDDIYSKSVSLKPCKSAGPDNLNPWVLKEAAFQLSLPLSLILTKSLDEGRIPAEWKAATIIPIFKKGDKSSPSNYHPVSLASVVSKVFESIVWESMMHHL